MWAIKARHNGEVEEIDEAESREDAVDLVAEYAFAFGPGWAIWREEESWK